MRRHGYAALRARAKEIFERNSLLHCPYFATTVVLNAEGLHHLRYSAERERSKPEQDCCRWCRMSSANQERCRSIGKSGSRPGGWPRRRSTGDWSPLLGRPDKIRVILRRIGTGNITFWSVMRGARILPDGRPRLAPENLEAD